jgi:hypothetical protein
MKIPSEYKEWMKTKQGRETLEKYFPDGTKIVSKKKVKYAE